MGRSRTGYALTMSSTPSAAAIPAQLMLGGAADAVTAAELRRALQGWLHEVTRMRADVRQDVVLGVNEALANCVEHAYRGAHREAGTMKLEASYDPAVRAVRVCVSNRGTWHNRPPSSPERSPCLARHPAHARPGRLLHHRRPPQRHHGVSRLQG